MPLASLHSVLSGNSHVSPDVLSQVDDNSYYKVNKMNLRNRSQSNKKSVKIKNIRFKKSKTSRKKKFKRKYHNEGKMEVYG
jgi:hypothetical protein